MKIYFATHNTNKLRELRALIPENLELLGLDDLGLHEEIPETADTIEGNSAMKTRYVFEKHGVACFGDDTGLEVDVLGGAPGVYSARYAGPNNDSQANMDLLLSNLKNEENRKARFKTVITYIDDQGHEYQFTGIAKGEIIREKTGAEGFGYDPVFLPEGEDRTFAEMSAAEKNARSHRARAFEQLIQFLKTK